MKIYHILLGNLAMEVVASTEVVVFSFGVFISTNRREVSTLATRSQQDKKKPYSTGNSLMQQG